MNEITDLLQNVQLEKSSKQESKQSLFDMCWNIAERDAVFGNALGMWGILPPPYDEVKFYISANTASGLIVQSARLPEYLLRLEGSLSSFKLSKDLKVSTPIAVPTIKQMYRRLYNKHIGGYTLNPFTFGKANYTSRGVILTDKVYTQLSINWNIIDKYIHRSFSRPYNNSKSFGWETHPVPYLHYFTEEMDKLKSQKHNPLLQWIDSRKNFEKY
mgnify:CR=1 FL=1